MGPYLQCQPVPVGETANSCNQFMIIHRAKVTIRDAAFKICRCLSLRHSVLQSVQFHDSNKKNCGDLTLMQRRWSYLRCLALAARVQAAKNRNLKVTRDLHNISPIGIIKRHFNGDHSVEFTKYTKLTCMDKLLLGECKGVCSLLLSFSA